MFAQIPKDYQHILQRNMNPILIRCGITNTYKRIEHDMATTKKFVKAAKKNSIISSPSWYTLVLCVKGFSSHYVELQPPLRLLVLIRDLVGYLGPSGDLCYDRTMAMWVVCIES